MNEKKKPKPLSLEETVRLLGAEVSEDIGPVTLDPIGLQSLATRVVQRMRSRRGRPTDISWEIARKVPMKPATWQGFQDLSAALADQDQSVRVAAGQLAAMALERGARMMSTQSVLPYVPGERQGQRSTPGWESSAECEEEAEELCAAIGGKGIW